MWYKVNKLNNLGYNKSQISRELCIDRGTVRKYLHLSEEEFLRSSSYIRQVNSKLLCYKSFIKSLLDNCQDFSSSQIHDRLKEHFSDFPNVHRNTIYNFVQKVRLEYHLPKKEVSMRSFVKLPETPYGEYAQVDFGEKWIYRENKRSKKVYFFALVLSRSRYKFIYLQEMPFTSRSAIYAHELAFEYLGGIPHKIIYDQDKVFIHSENLGDCLLTNDFKRFVSQHHFETIFCRKSDPQSKGKVENVVKYVKYNFLKGRIFTNIEQLNNEVLSWLDRTGNGLTHNGTKLVPSMVFKKEKSYLKVYNGSPCKVLEVMKKHTVRKDNTIVYRSNFYSLPQGTYQGNNSFVYSSINGRELIIYNSESGKFITKHSVSSEKGKLISQPEHRKRDSRKKDELEYKILSFFSQSEEIKLYLHELHKNKGRYYLDNLRYLSNLLHQYPKDQLLDSIITQINMGLYNTGYLLDYIRLKKPVTENKATSNINDLQPEKRSINAYKSII